MVDTKLRHNKPTFLPEEVDKMKASRDDLLEGMMLGMEPVEEKTGKHLVVIIADEGSEADGQQEEKTEDEDIYETKGPKGAEDDTPKEDFFDVEEGDEEQHFGAIEGMTEVTEDDENEFNAESKRLSVFVQRFGVEEESEAEKDDEDKPENKEETKVEEVPQTDSKTEEIAQDDSIARMRRLTKMMSIDQSAKIASSLAAFKSKELMEASKLAVDLSKVQYSGIIQREPRGYKPSIFTPNMYYDIKNRVESNADIMDFFDLENTGDGFLLPDYCEKEDEVEEVVSLTEEKPEPLDRTPYYKSYDECVENISKNKITNNVLQKIVIVYLKRRKVEYFLKESTFHLDQLLKYQDKLDMYQEIMELAASEKKSLTEELEVLKEKSAHHSHIVEKLFKTMQTRQANVGFGLIFTKTGATISDKVVERLLKRQKTQMDQVSTMRLKYLKLKGMVQDKLDLIGKTDNLENNLRLADYEQLKVDNRNYYDKMEEREEELVRLRSKCQNTIQILAHMREKTQALESDIDDLREELYYSAETADEHRASVAATRHTRDKYRKLIVDIKMESGLLNYPDLLIDMEEAQKDIQKVNDELNNCRQEFSVKASQIKNLRKNMERITEALEKKKRLKGKPSWATITTTSTIKSSKSNRILRDGPVVYSRRPTLPVPKIEQESFKDLIKIMPNPKTMNRRR